MLTAVAPDLWTTQHLLRLPAGVRMPARMTVVRLPGQGLLLHAPVPISDQLAGALDALGPVRHVVAPSCWHHLFVKPCLDRYPGAALHGVPGLPQKRRDLTFASLLGAAATAAAVPWADTLEPLPLAGAPALNEVVFFHRPSASLLVTDLLFNLTAPASWQTALLLRLAGTYKRFAMSRAWRLSTKDRPALKASLERVLERPFARVLPGHGDVFASADTRADTRSALRWALV